MLQALRPYFPLPEVRRSLGLGLLALLGMLAACEPWSRAQDCQALAQELNPLLLQLNAQSVDPGQEKLRQDLELSLENLERSLVRAEAQKLSLKPEVQELRRKTEELRASLKNASISRLRTGSLRAEWEARLNNKLSGLRDATRQLGRACK